MFSFAARPRFLSFQSIHNFTPPMRVLVTGGTGLLGNNVIRCLIQHRYQVGAIVRSQPDDEIFDGLEVELIRCQLVPPTEDSLDRETHDDQGALESAIARSDVVVHAAGKIHLGWTQIDQSLRINRDVTARIVDLCVRHDKKLVMIGTVNAIAVGSPNTPADETTPLEFAGGQVDCAYVVSKRAALQHVRRACVDGLRAVILHPGFMLGPWDWKPSSGRMLLEVGSSWRPVAPSGGCSLCDSRDVAEAIVTAVNAEIENGSEYILAGHNWTYKKLWSEMAVRMNRKPPIRAAGPGLEFLAAAFGDLATRIRGRETDVNSAGVKMSSQYHWYSSRRAQNDLNYQIRDASVTLDDASEWIRQRFILPRWKATR